MTRIDDRTLDGPHGALRVRVYAPAQPAGPGLVWLHGGAFFAGDLDMPEADATARGLADHGVTVVSVDYRLAPVTSMLAEWTGLTPRDGVHFPVASDEAVFAFRWALAAGLAPGAWALGGASAGANLAAGATLALRDDGEALPALVVLAYPTLQAMQDPPDTALRAALDANPAADVFGPAPVLAMYENYLGGPVDGADLRAIPGLAASDDLPGFPPTFIVTSEVDELRMSGEAFARALAGAGVEVDIVTEPDTVHGHLNDPSQPAAASTVARFAARLAAVRSPEPQEQS